VVEHVLQKHKPYRELRFVAGLIEYLGYVTLVFGWVFALWWLWSANHGGVNPHSAVVVLVGKDLFRVVSEYLVVAFALACTVAGIVIVAAGQIYKVFLDIRDDVHETMRLTQRLEIIASEADKT
jgi:hypothetical protein